MSVTDPADPGTPGEPAADGRLTGEVISYAGTIAPTGWLLCDGAALSRSTYAALFAVIGVSYGAGDGATTFNVPNTSGRMPYGASSGRPVGTAAGSATATISVDNMPAHSHSMSTAGAHVHTLDYSTNPGTSGANVPLGTGTLDRQSSAAVSSSGAHAHSLTETGGGSPIDLLPPMLSFTFLIRT